MKNYYQTLGVERNATPDDIKKAYRRLASQHHPDKGGDNSTFQEIQKAYETLSDDNKRAQYDNPQHGFGGLNGFRPGAGFDFDTIFDVFGARFHQQRPRFARMTLWITLADVAQGGNRTVSVGTHQGTNTVEIEIPLGIEDGNTVQYAGIVPGNLDLVVTFRIHPNPRWERRGADLIMDETVSVWDLILGSNLVIRDILGTEINITVPPQTQPGTLLRLKDRGLRQRSGPSGDLLVKVQAKIPETISPDLLESIKQYR